MLSMSSRPHGSCFFVVAFIAGATTYLVSAWVKVPEICLEGYCSSAWSEDAQGEAFVQTAIQIPVKSKQPMQAKSILADIQAIARSYRGDKLPPNMTREIAAFKTIVSDSILPALISQHNNSRTDVHTCCMAVKNANAQVLSKLKELESLHTLVNDARTNHTTCRTEEQNKAAASSACDDLKAFKEGIVDPAQKPRTSSNDEWRHYIHTMTDFWTPKKTLWIKKAEACRNETSAAAAHAEQCNHMQAQFEVNFCDWRTNVLDACTTFTTNYENTKKAYEEKKAAVEALMSGWKAEFTAIRKIECYLDHWTNKARQDAGGACESLVVNTSSMDIEFEKVANAESCDTSPVAVYPGHGDFKEKEYGRLNNASLAPISACPEQALGQDAPTTQTITTTSNATTKSADNSSSKIVKLVKSTHDWLSQNRSESDVGDKIRWLDHEMTKVVRSMKAIQK